MKKWLCCITFIVLFIPDMSHALRVEIAPETINPIRHGLPTGVDETFAVDVWVREASDLLGFYFVIKYDPSVITVVKSDSDLLSDFLSSTGRIVEDETKEVDNIAGESTFMAYTIPPGGDSDREGPSGDGKLATITFNVESVNDSAVTFLEEMRWITDTTGSPLQPEWLGAEVRPKYHIAASAGGNGAIHPSDDMLVIPGANQTFTITPGDECYDIADIIVDSDSVGTGSSHTFTNVNENHAISASFAKKTYTVEVSATEGGTISPSDSVPMTCGQDKTFTITPAACHEIKSIKVDASSVMRDVEIDENGTGTYMFEDVRNSHTIEADFERVSHIITASSGAHGTIDPSGEVSVECGSEPVFTITSDDCYQIADVTVDDADDQTEVVSVKADVEIDADIGIYTFKPVIEDQEIEATFSPIVYTMEITTGEGGSVKIMLDDEEKAEVPGGYSGTVEMNCGSEPAIVITPDGCYEIAELKVNDIVQEIELDGDVGTYPPQRMIENQIITASFAVKTYSVTVTQADSVTIEPSGTIHLECGSEPVFTITPVPLPPEDGYKIRDVKVDETSVMEDVTTEDWVVTYTFLPVTQDYTIEAISVKTHHITASAGENGAIEPFGDVFAADGDNQTFTITPDDGYYSSDVSIVSRQDAADGEPAETEITAGPLTDHIVLTDVKSDFEIRAEFGQNPKITVTPAENGTISPSEEVSVEYGEDQEFIIMPDKFYHLTGVVTDDESVEGEEIDGTGIHLYKFYEVAQDHSLEATFECTDSDINGDKTADLADAILILKLLAGIDITDAISPCADVNEDGRIGMTELLSVLYAMAGGR